MQEWYKISFFFNTVCVTFKKREKRFEDLSNFAKIISKMLFSGESFKQGDSQIFSVISPKNGSVIDSNTIAYVTFLEK